MSTEKQPEQGKKIEAQELSNGTILYNGISYRKGSAPKESVLSKRGINLGMKVWNRLKPNDGVHSVARVNKLWIQATRESDGKLVWLREQDISEKELPKTAEAPKVEARATKPASPATKQKEISVGA